MDDFKVKHFASAHSGRLPRYRKVLSGDVGELRRSLARQLGLPDEVDGLALVNAIAAASTWLEGLSAEADGFDLGRILYEQFRCGSDEEVLLNWYRYEELDGIEVSELSMFFRDIWYPASDDMDVVHPAARWILSIRHDGVVGVLRFGADR